MARTKGALDRHYNAEHAGTVQALAKYGVPYEGIAATIGCCVETLQKLYSKELALGRVDANAKVGKRLFEKAMEGDTASLIFWAKTRMGWQEKQRVDITSSDGSLDASNANAAILAKLTPEQIAALRGEYGAKQRRRGGR